MSVQISGSEIISLDPNAYVIDALYFMRRNNVRRLVVSNSDNIIGIFTIENAIRQILENKLEVRLNELRLKRPIFVEDNSVKSIVRMMISENSDFVIYRRKYIITEKDVVKAFNWSSVKEKIEGISKDAIVVQPFTKISTCIEIMLKNNIRHLPIVNGIALGIVSARDIAYSYDSITGNTMVEKIMNANLVTVEDNNEVTEAVNLMMERNVGSLIIRTRVKDKVKILTNRDLIKLIFSYIV
ncbi:CBS domain-containing protein [Sulfolobus sp. E5-1-F]|uniref:CBS domain-containing protein n=1 Tax=Sulfolobaceae TaxID=118883 RepID=UPI001297617E|nr:MULTISPECIES: CBS domain-containing protein [unclassified Sulfolobus]QGA54583.1 CBS domain-containing protein [Sulfolobus sp. E5-1-F]QGA67442.1 CBS domain-containing protein [Sulfolobus sp. E11-6]